MKNSIEKPSARSPGRERKNQTVARAAAHPLIEVCPTGMIVHAKVNSLRINAFVMHSCEVPKLLIFHDTGKPDNARARQSARSLCHQGLSKPMFATKEFLHNQTYAATVRQYLA